MALNHEPFTYENSACPWLCGLKEETDKNNEIIYIKDKNNESHKCSAEYLWSLNKEEREYAKDKVLEYYNENGFPYEKYNDNELISLYKKLKNKKPESVLVEGMTNVISNYGTCGIEICRHFCYNKFWKAASDSKRSIEDAFNDKELFESIVKNRMGWCLSNEGKEENNGNPRPYLFSITDKEIRKGIRNSGLGYGVSNFRPLIAKFIYSKYLSNITDYRPVIFDYSAGWGARLLGAMSLDYDYIGVDPLTSDNVRNMYVFYKDKYKLTTSNASIYNACSEDNNLYDDLYDSGIKVDMCFSSPPYFTLEVYDKTSSTQSYNKYSEYKEWIKYYWKPTCINCYSILRDGGYFGLVIKDAYGNYNLAADMTNVLEDKKLFNYILVDTYHFKTAQSHLSSKSKTKKNEKYSEIIYIYQKNTVTDNI